LQELGASPEQIDRERDRVHTELGVPSQMPTERSTTDEDTG
jgi:hypothetical protein